MIANYRVPSDLSSLESTTDGYSVVLGKNFFCRGTVLRTLIPKIAEGIFTVICKFNATNEYVLYYHSGRKTLRVFRARDGVMIANYRVPSDLSSLESTTDGYSVVLGKSKMFQ